MKHLRMRAMPTMLFFSQHTLIDSDALPSHTVLHGVVESVTYFALGQSPDNFLTRNAKRGQKQTERNTVI